MGDFTPHWTQCVYDFAAEGDQEMTLQVGNLIYVTSLAPNNWAFGIQENGLEGFFPRDYVAAVEIDRPPPAGAAATTGGGGGEGGGTETNGIENPAQEEGEVETASKKKVDEEDDDQFDSSDSESGTAPPRQDIEEKNEEDGDELSRKNEESESQQQQYAIPRSSIDEVEEEDIIVKCLDTGESLHSSALEEELEKANEKAAKIAKRKVAGQLSNPLSSTHSQFVLSLHRIEGFVKRERAANILTSSHPCYVRIALYHSGHLISEQFSYDLREEYGGTMIAFPCTPFSFEVENCFYRVLLKVEVLKKEHLKIHTICFGSDQLDQREESGGGGGIGGEERKMVLAKPKNKEHRVRGELYYSVVW